MNPSISVKKRSCFAVAAVAVALAIAVMVASPGLAQTKQVKKIPLSPETAALVDGQELYQAACAVCHGKTGKGDGPAAAALKTAVPDITVMARDNGGDFPVGRVVISIQGETPLAHGTEDMPIWGPVFRGRGSDALAVLRIANLAKYIKSIQVE